MKWQMYMCLWDANVALWKLLDNSAAEAAEGYLVTCDQCAALINEYEYGENDGLCAACHGMVHFICVVCGETFHVDDRSAHFPAMCTDCWSTKRQEIADGLWGEIEDLVGSWSSDEWEIPNLRKLLAYAKRLHKANQP